MTNSSLRVKLLLVLAVLACSQLLVSASSAENKLRRRLNEMDQDAADDEGIEIRRLGAKAGGGGGGDNPDVNSDRAGGGTVDDMECVDFEHPDVQEAALDEETDAECRTNDCEANNGCCRYNSNYLICDTSGAHPFSRCICNANTDRDAGLDGSAPIAIGPVAPVAPTTPSPTTSPTTPMPIGGGHTNEDYEVCVDGSTWQSFYPQYTPCYMAADCDGVQYEGQATCCGKAACVCAPPSTVNDQCVPPAP